MSTDRARNHRTILLGAVWLIFAATTLARAVTAQGWHGDLAHVPIMLAAGLGAWHGGRERAGLAAIGWRTVGAAWLVSAGGAAVWFVSRMAGSPMVEAVGTVLWNLYYPLMVAGLALLATRPQGAVRMARAAVEALTTGVGVAVLVYYFVGRHDVGLTTLLTNAVGETAVLTTAALLLARDRTEPSQRMLGAGALLATLSDLVSVAAPAGSAGLQAGNIALFLSAALVGTAGLIRPGVREHLRAPLEVTLRGLGHMPTGSTVAVLAVLWIETRGEAHAPPMLVAGVTVMVALLLLALSLNRYLAELEEDLRATQTERLATAQRFMAFGQFAGAAVHDLNNMITVLHGVAIELRAREPVPAEVEDLESATSRAAAICKEMLSFGRQGGTPATDLGAASQGLESLLRRLATRALQLEMVSPSEPLNVLADRGQLEMALVNLVANARDATKEGLITITTEVLSVTPDDWFCNQAVAAGRWAALSVRDTGCGMSTEVQARVFRPFFTTKGPRGTGLGLAQVADFAQQSGGHVLIDSAPGKGTVVWVLLRLA